MHTLVARFVGTTAYAGSSSASAKLTVQPLAGRAVTQVSLTATPVNQQTQQGLYNLSAAVTTPGGGSPATGAVTFTVTSPHTTTVLGTPALTTSGRPLTGFGAAPNSPTGRGNPVVADWNEDGILDLALVESTGDTLAVLRGVGDGTFPTPGAANAVPGLCGGGCVAIATADFNSDGHADLVTISPAGSGFALQFAYGKGDGSFTVSAPMAVALGAGLSAPQLVVGDYNGDGQPDLIVNGAASAGVAGFAVALQQADHSFVLTYPTSFGSAGVKPPALIAATDLNGDGKTDFVGLSSSALLTFQSNGDGSFTGKVVKVGLYYPYLLAVGDFNADGFADVVVFSRPNGVALGSPLFGDGHGAFTAGQTIVLDFPSSTNLLSLDAVDVNGDGIADLLLAELDEIGYGGEGPISVLGLVLTSDGAGGFTESSSNLPAELPNSLETSPLVAADLNGDGLPDVVYPQQSGCCVVLLNQSGAGSSSASLANVQMPVGKAGGLSLTANYGGDTRYLPGVSPTASVDGTPAPTTLQLTAMPASVAMGGSVTLTATLTPYAAQGYGTNGETVSFYINNQFYSGILYAGKAVLVIGTLPVGQYQVTAAYQGDGVFLAANSTPQPVVVTPAGPGDAQLRGAYVFRYSGMVEGGKAGVAAGVAGVGVFDADGVGGIGGEEDTNTAASTIAGSYLTGGYSLIANGTGVLHLLNDHGIEQDFVVVLSGRDSTTGVASAVTLLGTGPSGEVVAGTAVLQTPGAATSTGFRLTLGGSYTLALGGETACTGTSVCAGTGHGAGAVSLMGLVFFSGGTGTGPVVGNLAGEVGTDSGVTFTVPAADLYGRTALTVQSSVAPADQPRNYAGYYASSGEMYIISIDPHATRSLLSGSLEKQ